MQPVLKCVYNIYVGFRMIGDLRPSNAFVCRETSDIQSAFSDEARATIRYRAPGAVLRRLLNESPAQTKQRWQHCPQEKLEGSWFVHQELTAEALQAANFTAQRLWY